MSMSINSLKALGTAWNATHDSKVKIPKPKKVEIRKCSKCGMPMRNIPGTNVWLCEFASVEEKVFKDEEKVQVFTRCGNREFSA